jgi:hypothetical protein
MPGLELLIEVDRDSPERLQALVAVVVDGGEGAALGELAGRAGAARDRDHGVHVLVGLLEVCVRVGEVGDRDLRGGGRSPRIDCRQLSRSHTRSIGAGVVEGLGLGDLCDQCAILPCELRLDHDRRAPLVEGACECCHRAFPDAPQEVCL